MLRISITFLLALFTAVTLFGQDNANYIGVWRSGYGQGYSQSLETGPNAVGTQNFPGFTDIRQYASRTDGFGLQHYGVFSLKDQNIKSNIMVGTIFDLNELLKKNADHPTGQHIHSIETSTHPSHKITRYHVILKPGNKKQEFRRALGWDSFVYDWKDKTKKGMRLREIIVERINAKLVRFGGLYEPGTGGHYLYSLTGWKAFTDKWAELGKKNYRLVDVETFKVGSQIQYIGVWAPGKDQYALIQVTGFNNFRQKFNEMKLKGLVLVDLDIIN